jgi:hypothetical protein
LKAHRFVVAEGRLAVQRGELMPEQLELHRQHAAHRHLRNASVSNHRYVVRFVAATRQ